MARKYSKEIIEAAISKSKSIAEALRHLGINRIGGGHYRMFHQYVTYYQLDTTHFKGQAINKGISPKNIHTKESFTAEVLCKQGKAWATSAIRQKLLLYGLKENRCEECLISEWNGKPISLHLDHIDGDSTNNELSNLRILCPNCHSQTPTFGVRNVNKRRNASA